MQDWVPLPLASRAAIPKKDKGYHLHWVLFQITPLIPDLRQLALTQYPAIPFEEISLIVALTRWPMRVLLRPLQLHPYTFEDAEGASPHAMHFWNLAKMRVDQGDVNTTIRSTYYNKRHGRGLQYAVVDLDKNPPEKTRRSEHSACKCVMDSNRNPIAAKWDVLDTIMEDLKRDALEDKNVWSGCK